MRLSTGKLIAKFIENSDRILAPIIDRMTDEEHAEYTGLQEAMAELLRAVKSKPEGRG